MRFKVGDTWHEIAPGQPLMIEFDDPHEIISLSRMEKGRTRFAQFFEEDQWTKEQRLDWMNKGAKVQAENLQEVSPLKPGWYVWTTTLKKIKEELGLED